MIANPFRLLQCCLVTGGGGAVILVAAERARDFPQKLAPGLNRGRSTCSHWRERRDPDGQLARHSRGKRESRAQGFEPSPWTPASAGG
jgi:hypothetical protein